MTVYIAIDDENGMLFNNRRQSQDRILRANMMEDCKDTKLWISQYSKKFFVDENGNITPSNVVIDDNYLALAGENDCCYVEKEDITPYINKIDTIVLYKWNVAYPADTYFNISLLDSNWKKHSTNYFKGSSHDKIYKEVWKRV